MDPLDAKYCRGDRMVAREIGGQVVVVPVRQAAGDPGRVFMLNETAARVWALIDGQRSGRDIKDVLAAEFDVPPDAAERDLLELLARLESLEAVFVVREPNGAAGSA